MPEQHGTGSQDLDIPIELRGVLEPVGPAHRGIDAAGVPGALHQTWQEPGGLTSVVSRRVVFEGLLLEALLAVPRGRPRVEILHGLRLAPFQLGAKDVMKKVVVAVPRVGAIERHEEQVGLLPGLEPRSEIAAIEQGVADGARQSLEDRCAECELQLLVVETIEQLRPEILARHVGHRHPIAHGGERRVAIGRGHRHGWPAWSDRAVRYTPAGHPSRWSVTRETSPGDEIDARSAQDGDDLFVIERKVGHPDHREPTVRDEPRQRQPARRPAQQDELRACRDVARQAEDCVGSVRVGHAIEVIKDEDQRSAAARAAPSRGTADVQIDGPPDAIAT